MDGPSRIIAFLTDDRLFANLIAVHVAVGVLLVLSVLVRYVLQLGGDRVFVWLGAPSLRGVTQEATEHVRNLVYWITVTLMLLAAAAGIAYHVAGRDVRRDVAEIWTTHMTPAQLAALAVVAGKLAAVVVAACVAGRLVHRLRLRMESSALSHWPEASERPEERRADPGEHALAFRRWFNLLERFALALVVLGSLSLAARIANAPFLSRFVGFTLPILSTLVVARLLTLALKTLSRAAAALGDRRFTASSVRPYWERIERLFPFGEKCFEALVYVWAAATVLGELKWWPALIEERGPQATQCIGIFFLTRVVIELLHVLIQEAFGVFDESRPLDQKGQTLVPLLQSAVQYALYFGCVLVMLEVIKGPTQTILAGAGLVGLAVGLGAQSLVGDVVSGFFILFENQYLVGDVVQIGDANGRVEAVSIRHTQIRDDFGKLHIIPNGQIKSVVNYSKSYVNAVVDIKVPTSMNVEQVLKDLAEAGRRLRTARREVLAETQVKGLVDLTPAEMTIRAVTKVMPGTHTAMQNEFRRLLREVFEQRQNPRSAA